MAGTFDFWALRFHFRASKTLSFPRGTAANHLRGALGKNLRILSEQAYWEWFAPSSSEGPSGLRDRPRPFVVRVAHLEAATIPEDAPFCAGLNVFDPRAVGDLSRAMGQFALLESIESQEVSLPLEGIAAPCGCLHVRFLTPTELKGADRPEFGVLWARLRDRISTLRELYGAGPLKIDFREMGERAARIRMSQCEISHIAAERLSGSSGQRHSIGGFTGFAEYEGELSEFVPYLEIGRYTGVGRQTVWGKGEIGVETF